MRQQRAIAIGMLVGALLGASTPAFADITGFLGLAGGPSTRGAKGVSVGTGLVVFGVEFEYCQMDDDTAQGTPLIRTGMLNGLVQTPVAVAGIQFYATAGGGVYHMELGALSDTSVGVNVGGGLKKTLIGPLRIRVDYRFFRFSGFPLATDTVHRVYVGANLRF